MPVLNVSVFRPLLKHQKYQMKWTMWENLSPFLRWSSELFILRIFRLLISSLFLYVQCFSWHIFQPFSGISCPTQESTKNLKLNPLFEWQGYTVPILLTITRYESQVIISIPIIITCCWDWTHNLQMISLRSIFWSNGLSFVPWVLAFWVNFFVLINS